MTAWAAEELTAKDLPTALSPRFLLPALQESRNQTATHIIAQWAAIFLGEIIVTTVLVIQTWRQRISDLVKEEASLETRRIAEIEIASVLPGPTGLIRMLLRGAYLTCLLLAGLAAFASIQIIYAINVPLIISSLIILGGLLFFYVGMAVFGSTSSRCQHAIQEKLGYLIEKPDWNIVTASVPLWLRRLWGISISFAIFSGSYIFIRTLINVDWIGFPAVLEFLFSAVGAICIGSAICIRAALGK